MMKSMSKTVFALCIAVSIFVCSSMIASANCPDRKDGLHCFTKHVGTGEGYTDYLTHDHLIGYDANGREVYKSCQVTMVYEYYVEKCCYCDETQSGSRKLECEVRHSVN